jgi:diguanylate cyclase (GGDEF)-like protein/PAS domain S-box-containing protein
MPVGNRSTQEAELEMRLRFELERRAAITPAMLHSIDEKGRLISVSDMWLAKLGYSREEVIGCPSSDFLTPESREYAVREVLPEFFRLGRCDDIHYQMLRKDGGVIDVLLSGILETNPFGNGRVSLAVMTDITALQAIKGQLVESEARYRGLVEDQSELVSLASPEGDLRYVNFAHAAFYGKRPEEMIGRNVFEYIPEESHAAVAAHLKQVCTSGHGITIENRVLLPNGQKRWMQWTNRALTDSNGRVTAIHSVGRDIEERVRAEQRLQESENRHRFLAENSTDLILLVGRDGKRLYASPACKPMLGYEPHEMLAIESRDAVHPEDAKRVLSILAKGTGRPTQTDYALRYQMKRKDGSYLWVETTGRAVDVAGQPDHRLIVVRDIDLRMQAEQILKESEARYRLLADNSSDIVLELDRHFVRQYVSPACRELLGYEPEEMVGINPIDVIHPEDAPRLTLVLQTLRSGQTDRHSIINRIRHRNGGWVWVEAQLRAVKAPDTGEFTGIIGSLRDISARKLVEDELAEANRRLLALAGQDSLTGLANRRAFDEALAKEHRRARREKTHLGLVMIDVDRFKAFNDHYGHPAGDDCLKRIGRVIAEAGCRPDDLAARYGGEEFAVLLPDIDELGAEAIAERIRKAVLNLAIRHDANPNGLVTISAGTASSFGDAAERGPQSLVNEADQALYRAKEIGRNAVVRATSAISGAAATSRATA